MTNVLRFRVSLARVEKPVQIEDKAPTGNILEVLSS